MKCTKCGAEISAGATFCEYCGQELTQGEAPVTPVQEPVFQQSVVAEKKENFVAGIVGALIGAAIGAAAIVLVGYMGYVASICGLVLAVCTLKGYELLGGKLSVKGIVVCVALMLLMPYVADRINWAIAIVQGFADQGVTFGMAFAGVHEVIKELEMTGDYFKDLGMLYLFTALGAFSVLRGLLGKK